MRRASEVKQQVGDKGRKWELRVGRAFQTRLSQQLEQSLNGMKEQVRSCGSWVWQEGGEGRVAANRTGTSGI